jgi:sugar phosphate isomerase/epimerase
MNQPNDRLQSRRRMMIGAMSLGAAAALGLTAGPRLFAAEETQKHPLIPDDCKINGFAIGCQAWTFNHFTVLEAIEKTAVAGGKVIEFFPGQRLEKDQPAVTFGHTSPQGVIEKVQAKLKDQNVRAVNYGVVTVRGKDEWRKVFEFAKKMGLIGVTSEPNPADMDDIEKLVQEYDVRFGIHDHPKQPKNENYKFWDPNYVLSLVKDRDKRMGSCADTGHWVRSGIKPVDALKVLEGRIMSSHLKDLNEFSPGGHDMPWGNGVSDVKSILAELKRQGFEGNISVEYEYHMEDNLKEVTECIDYVKNLKIA